MDRTNQSQRLGMVLIQLRLSLPGFPSACPSPILTTNNERVPGLGYTGYFEVTVNN